MTQTLRRGFLLTGALTILILLLAVAPLPRIPFWGIDIYTFRAAAKAMMLRADPYHTPNIPRFADGVTVGNIHDYLYAPYFAFALRPLALLPPEAVSRIWFGLNLFLYLASLGLLLLALRWSPKPNNFLLLIAALVLFPPLRTTLVIGQSTILMLFFFSLSFFLLRQHRPWMSGLIFSLGLFKPHLFPLLLFFVVYRQWRWLTAVGIGLLLLNLPFITWLDNWFMAAAATHAANLAPDQCFQMVSLVSLVNCTLTWPSWLTVVIVAVLGLVLFWGGWWSISTSSLSSKVEEQIFDRHLAIYIIFTLLLIDHTRIADQLLFIYPLLVVWRDWRFFSSPWLRRVAVGLVLFIYMIPYTLDGLQSRHLVYQLPFWYIGISISLLALLLIITDPQILRSSSRTPQQFELS